jgi:glycosyltransferase involved in cell wall biosynthesis
VKVLLAAHAFPPRSTAGVEVYTLRLARGLLRSGHEVRVLAAAHDLSSPPYAVRARQHAGVEVVEVVNLHQHGTLRSTYEDEAIDRVAAAVLDEFRPDVLHLQHLLNLSAGLPAVARRAGVPVVLTLHDYWLSCPRDGLRMRADLALCSTVDHAVCAQCLKDSPYLVPPLQARLSTGLRRMGLVSAAHRLHAAAPRAVEGALALIRRHAPPASNGLAAEMDRRAARLRAAAGDVTVFLAPTSFVRERTIELGIDPARVRVWPLGATFGAPRARRAGPRRRFGYVGTLLPHKGVHVLIEAFRALAAPDLSLEIHGSAAVDPDYAHRLRQLAAGDSRVRFCGPFPEGEQQRVLGGLDALVLPSLWWENSPLTVLEALAAGLPVIATTTGGVPELLQEAGRGLLAPPGDVAALRELLDAAASGRVLSGALPPLAIKTVDDETRDLAVLYRSLVA